MERETRKSTAPTVTVPWTRIRGQEPHSQSRFHGKTTTNGQLRLILGDKGIR